MIYITYAKAELEHVSANRNQMNAEERTKLIGILKDFEEFLMEIWETGTQSPLNLS